MFKQVKQGNIQPTQNLLTDTCPIGQLATQKLILKLKDTHDVQLLKEFTQL